MSVLECRRLTVGYSSTPVLRELDLSVAPGQSVALLGPSGSGKTTLLHTIAGFLLPSGGELLLRDRLVASAAAAEPPERRNVGLVFQHYALWPHLSALDTVAYPIRRRGVRASEARRQAQELLDRMGIGSLAQRRPAELSGGQQQRVGLARALARAADVYLFDEPTAHLDAPLRTALQEELSERRRETGAGALYATHDSAEALAVADRVALLRDGRVVQSGPPVEIYDRPVDLWAARLTGVASVVEVELARAWSGGAELRVAGDTATVAAERVPPGARGLAPALVRPDWTALGGPLPGMVRQVWYRGPHTDYRLDTPAGEVVVRLPGAPRARAGEPTGWTLARVWLLLSRG